MLSLLRIACLAALLTTVAFAQNASLTGTVKDAQDAVVSSSVVTLTDIEKKTSLKTVTNQLGFYEFPTLRPGSYSLRVEAQGFRSFKLEPVVLEVGERGRADASLTVGEVSSTVAVTAEATGVETESSAIGEVISTRKMAELPFNGRFFLDLAQLAPGTVLGSTNNRAGSTASSAFGAFSINSSGARSDQAAFLLDGINLNDGSQIEFQPNIDSIQEFKVVSNAFSAEYGRSSGISITAVSKTGTNSLHGGLFEYLRNDKLDALNFFDLPRAAAKAQTGREIAPFKRNIFGESVGGPVFLPRIYDGRSKTFFFHSYEGRRQRESETFNVTVPTAAQRSSVTNPVILNLLPLIPSPNAPGTVNNFTGNSPRFRNLDQTTERIDHTFNPNNMIYASAVYQTDIRNEPSSIGLHNLPGFGDNRAANRRLIAFGYTHVFSPSLTEEFRAGGNRIVIDFTSQTQGILRPSDFGITAPDNSNFLDIRIAGGPAFGAISSQPQGRADTTYQANYTLSWFKGSHSMKYGVEYRSFYNNAHNGGTGGLINFSSLATFLSGTPVRTSVQVGAVTPAVAHRSVGLFAQDDYKVTQRLTLNLGLRYEYNSVPTERNNRLETFDFTTNQLIQTGTNGAYLYAPDHFQFGPRVGFAYDLTGKGRTVLRGGAGIYYDQPLLSLVSGMASNPPFAQTSINTSTGISLLAPFAAGAAGSISPNGITKDFKGARVPQWNVNLQHLAWGTVFQISYIGSAGRRLPVQIDYNQGINGVRLLAQYGPVNLNESVSKSSYNALWLSANKRLSKGLTFSGSYTFSKSIDLNSVNGGAQIQDSWNLSAERGLSDFDARHRVVVNAIYELPFRAKRLKPLAEGWSLSAVGNYQSGNPFSPIISTLRSGTLNLFDRPNVVPGQSVSLADPDPALWFNTGAFSLNALNTFGNTGRNVLTGPDLKSVDFSILKNFKIKERAGVQFRAEAFNLANHPNLGQPGNTVGAANFGVIQTTRSSRGDFGSSRQIEFALRFLF
jgi:outer membrane receptor protein involved in Fe transport